MQSGLEVKWVRALYPFSSTSPDELPFPQGARLLILETKSKDDGWWIAEYNGRKGMIPSNYVLPEDDPADSSRDPSTAHDDDLFYSGSGSSSSSAQTPLQQFFHNAGTQIKQFGFTAMTFCDSLCNQKMFK
eukprot:TRINITY_DN8225_c0_g1_i1.p1 TRINITY_DN8225_c0_g1~~TRINITY_DN8225_c0_g1_i1.p1  ORF type:complete len:131 (-),score=34.58 TRINITY_DN8225_c0_g1_i1:99-491(-)